MTSTRSPKTADRIKLAQLSGVLLDRYGAAPRGGLRELQAAAASARIPAIRGGAQWSVAASDLDKIALALGLLPVPSTAA